MTQKQMIELVQQHHPAMGETETRLALNRAQSDYCDRTELIKTTYTQDSVAGQRYYTIDSSILRIAAIQINDVEIPRLIGKPIIDDDEFDSQTGLTAPTTSSNDRYWYVDSDRLGIVEKITGAVTRDDRQTDYQSISVVKEIRVLAIAKAADFTINLTEETALPTQFHDALVYKVVSDGYLRGENLQPQLSQLFDMKYKELIKSGKKRARDNYVHSGAAVIRPMDY
jgi:hypothetical protein